MNKDKGLRFNDGKTRHDLTPAFAQEQYARVLTEGAKKYAPRNWESGMAWSKVMASLKRHINAFERGDDYDPETGILHMAHVMCNAGFLVEYYKIYPQGDDRAHSYLSTPKIGLDIDEVICDWVGAWTKRFKMEVPNNWFFDRDIMSKFEELKSSGELESFYLSLQPLISPKDIPFEPHCYVTSRPVEVSITEQWLDKHGFPTRPVYGVGMGDSKVDAIKRSGVDIFVDDRYDNFVELNQNGICCFLFDTTHNQRYDVGYKRIKHLSELLYETNRDKKNTFQEEEGQEKKEGK